jgi:hypothetical protein
MNRNILNSEDKTFSTVNSTYLVLSEDISNWNSLQMQTSQFVSSQYKIFFKVRSSRWVSKAMPNQCRPKDLNFLNAGAYIEVNWLVGNPREFNKLSVRQHKKSIDWGVINYRKCQDQGNCLAKQDELQWPRWACTSLAAGQFPACRIKSKFGCQ